MEVYLVLDPHGSLTLVDTKLGSFRTSKLSLSLMGIIKHNDMYIRSTLL